MAKQSRQNKSTDELKAKVAGSRDRFARDLRALRTELDFPRKIKRSFQQQTLAWITAAVVVGALLVVLPTRKKKIEVAAKPRGSGSKNKLLEAGFAMGALKIAATLLKPAIVAFITNQVRGHASRRPVEKK